MTIHIVDVDQVAYTVNHAAKAVDQSPVTIRRAIHSTDPNAFPPPLRAKRAGTGDKAPYLIPRDALIAWVASLPDA